MYFNIGFYYIGNIFIIRLIEMWTIFYTWEITTKQKGQNELDSNTSINVLIPPLVFSN